MHRRRSYSSGGRPGPVTMVATPRRLADALTGHDVPVWRCGDGSATDSHAFAIDAGPASGGRGGHGAAQRLRAANVLTSAIGLPHDDTAGVRVGVNEAVRWGLDPDGCDALAELVAEAWRGPDPTAVASRVSELRSSWREIRFCR